MIQVETTVEADDGEYTVVWEVHPGRAAKISGPMEGCYPEEPPTAEAQYCFVGSHVREDVETFFTQNGINYGDAEEAAFLQANEDYAASREDER